MLFTATVDPAAVNPRIKLRVQDFILKVCNNQSARWPGDRAVLWKNGIPVNVVAGSSWGLTDTEMYLYHNADQPVPVWVPGMLSALAKFFGLAEDTSIKEKIIEMAAKMAADIFQPVLQCYAIQTMDGLPVRRVAVNLESKLMVATVETPTDNEEVKKIEWKTMQGETVEVNPDDDSWMIIQM